jgi:hypothetical protein
MEQEKPIHNSEAPIPEDLKPLLREFPTEELKYSPIFGQKNYFSKIESSE